ncbi:hypothetical protein J5893_00555 [bacterium]|nr:hypothetical protein [bacterium]
MKTYYRSLVLIIFLGCLIKSFFLAHQEFLLSAQWVSSIEVFASRMLSDFMVIAIIG